MKRIFGCKGLLVSALLLLAGAFSSYADSYRDALVKLNETAGGLVQKKDKFVKAFSGLAIKEGCSAEEAEKLAGEFYDSVFVAEAYDRVESIYRPLVSESDLQATIAFFSSPAAKVAKEHSEVYESEAAQQRMMTKMYPDLVKLATGEKTGKVTSVAPKSYQKLFHEYYKASGQEKSMDGVVKQIVTLSSGGDEKLTKSITNYFTENIEVLVMDCGYPTVTEEDLSALSGYFKSDAGKRLSAGNSAVLKDAVKFGVAEAMKFGMMVKEKKKEGKISSEGEAE